MRGGVRVFAVAAFLLGALAGNVASQQGEETQKRSTLSGVFTQAQAARGRDTYVGMCKACHTPESHTSPAFVHTWSGRPLWDLFLYISSEMPKSDPGSLAPGAADDNRVSVRSRSEPTPRRPGLRSAQRARRG